MRYALKTLVVLGLTLALLIALGMIRGTVAERQRYRAEAVEEVARSSAGAQSIEGPVLFVPYSDRVMTTEVDRDGSRRTVETVTNGTWVFLPKSLEVKGTLRPVPRMRGLHQVRVYELGSTLRARFDVAVPVDDDPGSPRTIDQPRLGFGIADVRGLIGSPSLHLSGEPQALLQGQGDGGSGVHAMLPAPVAGSTFAFDAEFTATLQGTETLSIAPLGDATTIDLASTWPHPQFHGDFLPRTRTVTADGFRARWEVSSLASNAQRQFAAGAREQGAQRTVDAISVTLVDPVNVYTQVDRATKYGLLFVALTFAAFALFELLKQLRIHPIQYGLVGLALAIFFLLLLALSERIAFGIAYVVAATACVLLIGYYLGHVLGGWPRGAGFAAMLGALYAALYGLLISEDNAMVMGAGMLFTILAAVMVVTRNIDWYQASASPAPSPRQ